MIRVLSLKFLIYNWFCPDGEIVPKASLWE